MENPDIELHPCKGSAQRRLSFLYLYRKLIPMSSNLFHRYIWLADTIYRAGRITFAEINRQRLLSSMPTANLFRFELSTNTGKSPEPPLLSDSFILHIAWIQQCACKIKFFTGTLQFHRNSPRSIFRYRQ